MIRRILPVLFSLLVLAAFAGTLIFLYQKSRPKPVPYQTVNPIITTIIKKAVAPGAILPRKEVAIKSRVSGVVEKFYVKPGDPIKDRAPVAKIEIVPNMINLNSAESKVTEARINLTNAQREYDRSRRLLEQKLATETDFSQRELTLELRQQELVSAQSNLELVKEGAARKSGKVGNIVISTLTGTVLDVPIKEGSSVIEANNFNEGTTLATIADMNDLMFQGRVDESEVGKLELGMPVTINVGALGSDVLEGRLEFIAPKGKDKEGSIEFEVHASVKAQPGILLRANYSANADIILDRREQVLAIDEGAVKFEKGKSYVEVELEPNHFEQREVKLGLSDGILVEVVAGVDKNAKLKKQGLPAEVKPQAG